MVGKGHGWYAEDIRELSLVAPIASDQTDSLDNGHAKSSTEACLCSILMEWSRGIASIGPQGRLTLGAILDRRGGGLAEECPRGLCSIEMTLVAGKWLMESLEKIAMHLKSLFRIE